MQTISGSSHGEQLILSCHNHPNIARYLSGGTTERGVAYMAMEYVEGVPINVYCPCTAAQSQVPPQVLRTSMRRGSPHLQEPHRSFDIQDTKSGSHAS